MSACGQCFCRCENNLPVYVQIIARVNIQSWHLSTCEQCSCHSDVDVQTVRLSTCELGSCGPVHSAPADMLTSRLLSCEIAPHDVRTSHLLPCERSASVAAASTMELFLCVCVCVCVCVSVPIVLCLSLSLPLSLFTNHKIRTGSETR